MTSAGRAPRSGRVSFSMQSLTLSSPAGTDYSRSRESGNEAAYANILNVPDQYTESLQTLAGQPVMVRTLTAAPQIQKVWFRLPDGGVSGLSRVDRDEAGEALTLGLR